MGNFGDTTRRLRKEHGLTLEKVASQAGTHKSYLSGIENGKVNPPSLKIIRKMAKVLKIDEKKLVTLAYIEKAPKMIRKDIKQALLPQAVLEK